MINLFEIHVSPKAIKLVTQVLKSGFVNQGPMVDQFEDLLRQRGFTNPVTLNSCTSALHLSLILAGIKENDEVILPAQSFISTGLVVLMMGAKPIFCDIDLMSGNISGYEIKKRITNKTKAVVVVHWGGYPANLEHINKICKEHNLVLIEDAAHALGATYENSIIGDCKYSDYCCFSLQAIKTLTTGDGGILCVKDKDKYEKALRLRWFGADKKHICRNKDGSRSWNIQELGYKYHMNDVIASLGIGNLDDVENIIKKRREIAHRYDNEINNCITKQYAFYQCDPSYWLYTIIVSNRDKLIQFLNSKGIASSTVDTRIDKHDVFGGITPNLIWQQKFDQQHLCIPCHHKLTNKQVDYIIDCINKEI